ncbi:hypothetical protein MLD38_034560 [Melastoma candidum]|uniref:Uncharacterized protein n=1 Tax=Melastoma candidum TaxID=119954 RepID=A0ACB9MCL5_9MYRT|nr:hypothetical protein MLD38_034560 [Melastoma candidum]
MDSGNSSSMRSSSGGDDDVDSKVESSVSMTMHMPMPLFLDHHALSLPNYYNLNNSFLPSSLMYDPDYLPHGPYSSQTQQQPQQDLVLSGHLHLDSSRPGPSCTGRQGGLPVCSSLSPRQTVSVPQGLAQEQRYPPSSTSVTTTKEPKKAARNPRKRTRASRKAPTTVLATDTTNFRVMVQEFTGFPAPPFSGSGKLDLFGSGSIFRSSNHGQDPLSQLFPLRPSAQKFQQPPLMGNSTDATPNADSSCIINNALMSNITSSIAEMATTAKTNNAPANTASPLNLPKHPSGVHQNTLTLPDSDILDAFPLLTHNQNPLNTPGSLRLFEANSNAYFQDLLSSKWDDGLQARGIGTAGTQDGHDHPRPSSNEVYGHGTRRVKMNPSHNNDKGLENRAVENWFGPSD